MTFNLGHSRWSLSQYLEVEQGLPCIPGRNSWPPNNSMEPPPLRFAKHPERAGDLRPIPASRVFGFGAILVSAGLAAHTPGAPQLSRPLGGRPKVPRCSDWKTPQSEENDKGRSSISCSSSSQ